MLKFKITRKSGVYMNAPVDHNISLIITHIRLTNISVHKFLAHAMTFSSKHCTHFFDAQDNESVLEINGIYEMVHGNTAYSNVKGQTSKIVKNLKTESTRI